jgi:hypothetical protein
MRPEPVQQTSPASPSFAAWGRWGWPALLSLNFALLARAGWGAYAHYQIDTYQSAYVVGAVARGELPYLDFSYYFGPLALELYGALLGCTGPSLDALFACGLAVIAICCLLIWQIMAGLELPPVVRGSTCMLFLDAFAFNNLDSGRLSNFVFPYSHSSTHALMLMLAGLRLSLAWQKRGGTGLAAAWGLCAAGVLLNRPDVGVVFAVLSLVHLHRLCRGPWRDSLALAAAALLPPLAVYGFFASRIGWSRLILQNLLWVGHNPAINGHQRFIFGWRAPTLKLVGLALVVHLAAWWLVRRLGERRALWSVPLAVLAVQLLVPAWALFCDLQVLLLGLLLKGPRQPRAIPFMGLLSAALLARILFRLTLKGYFFYLGVIPTMLLMALLWRAFPSGSQRCFLLGLVWASCARLVAANMASFQAQSLILQTPAGSLRALPTPAAEAFQDVLLELQARGVQGRSLLVLPEGAMLNFLTGSRHPLYHATLLPHTVAAYGEPAILGELEKARPDFVVLMHRVWREFDDRRLGGYAPRVLAWLRREYRPVASFGPPPFRSGWSEGGGAVLYARKGTTAEGP